MNPSRVVVAIAALLILLLSLPARAAKPFLHPIFQDNMVLQRDMTAPVWGWAEAGKEVKVTINGKTATATADPDGKWMAKVGPLPAGGPFEMTVSGPEQVKLANVMIGVVWLCSGQSNMQMGIEMVKDSKEEIAKADHPNLRLFTVPMNLAYEPQSDLPKPGQFDKWLVCTPKDVTIGQWGGFSAAAYFFGRDLEEKLHVPIGLIHASWGGTIAEAWVSQQSLEQMPDFTQALHELPHEMPADKKKRSNPNQVTVLYNGMIAPLEPLAIKGAIWYQGESNAGRGMQYRTLLPTLIRDWRGRFSGGDFPFFIVQLASFQPEVDKPGESQWAELREAQDLAAKTVGHSAVAVALDIGDAKDIHPKNKQEVGRRLALDALALAYGRDIEYAGPTFTKMDVDGNKAVLHFDHLGGGLEAKGNEPLKGFAISEDGKKFVWGDAKIEGDTVAVTSPDVAQPTAVRYGWADNGMADNLFNKAGLPAPPFRTDAPK
jgi:sialate O-acetylesterase